MRHLRHKPPQREPLKAVFPTTMLELERLAGEVQSDVILYGVGVDCEAEGEVSDGIL